MTLIQIARRIPVAVKSLQALAQSPKKDKSDALELLIQEHMKVEGLFMRLKMFGMLADRIPSQKKLFRKRQEQTFSEIRKNLEKHMFAEEHVFYPACESHESIRALTLQSFEKHEQVKNLIRELNSISPDHESYAPKLQLLIEDVMNHVQEEEGMLFPQVRKIFTKAHLVKMTAQLRHPHRHMKKPARKHTLKAA